jgi:hypothetical protein
MIGCDFFEIIVPSKYSLHEYHILLFQAIMKFYKY